MRNYECLVCRLDGQYPDQTDLFYFYSNPRSRLTVRCHHHRFTSVTHGSIRGLVEITQDEYEIFSIMQK